MWMFTRVSATVATAGFITAVVLATAYLLGLPIFDQIELAWCLFWALIAFGFALFAVIVRAIWDSRP